ncbi:HepT-like ribonuclease domain-containing protein [Nitrosomonas europaea]
MRWKEISGFRNILVHNYLGDIDVKTVAAVMAHYLPRLENCIKDMLERNS